MYKGLSFRTFSNLQSLNQEKSKHNRQILQPKIIMVKYTFFKKFLLLFHFDIPLLML